MGLFFNNQDIANAGVTEKAVLYSRSRFSCEPSEIGAAKPDGARLLREAPAAFRRLCVETFPRRMWRRPMGPAAFRRLCVETLNVAKGLHRQCQPPSGGCVLKQYHGEDAGDRYSPAAFRRLRVETLKWREKCIGGKCNRLQATVY